MKTLKKPLSILLALMMILSVFAVLPLTVYNSKLDLSNSYLGVNGDEEHIRTNITVVCYKGSEAAKYAKSCGFTVKYL